ncbi:MAG: LytR/AlgR family response regulator transcription factor [Pseudomonadota bacterium]
MNDRRTLQLMIVDDEPIARQRLCALVEELGHQVSVMAGEARQARALLELEDPPPDVLLLDIEMPGENGVDLANELAHTHPELVVILVTAHDDFSLQAFEAGVRDYVLKPVRRERLARALQRALPLARAREEVEAQEIRLNMGRRKERVPLSRIDCFMAEDGYVVARAARLEGFVNARLHELEEAYGNAVLRIHRRCLAVRESIKGIETLRAGDHRVLFHDGLPPVPISRRQLPRVREFLRQRAG